MKTTEMNTHQKAAFNIVKEIMSDLIGGAENNLLDCEESSQEYQQAENYLKQSTEELVETIYTDVIDIAELRGGSKHIKFAGTDFIKERITRRLKKWGY